MRSKNSLEQLSAFYTDLESVPTPYLAIPPRRGLGLASLILTPAGAALAASLFISLCGSGVSKAQGAPPHRILLDQYARQGFIDHQTESSVRHASLAPLARRIG